MMPDHHWHLWKFRYVPHHFWRDVRSQCAYFNWLCVEMDLSSPRELYSLTIKDLATHHGGGLLYTYFNNSPLEFVKRLKPEFAWNNWWFKGNWKWDKAENHRLFFDFLSQELGVKKVEDWYTCLTAENIIKLGGTHLLKQHYGDSPFTFLSAMTPNHKWVIWKFPCVPSGFWKWVHSRVTYFLWLCEEANLLHPNMFYTITQEDIWKRKGRGLLKYYRNSPEKYVMCMNPELDLVLWKFRRNRKWDNKENHLKFFKWVGEKFRLQSIEDWRSLPKNVFEKVNAVEMLRKFYSNAVSRFAAAHSEYEMIKAKNKEEEKWMRELLFQLLPYNIVK